MSKNEVQKSDAGGVLTSVGGAMVPDFLAGDLANVAGLGNSADLSDSSLPFLGIIQSGSPQIKEENAKFIQDSKAGYLFNTATRQFWPSRVSKGEDGLVVVPVGYMKKFVEWKPNRGGYAETHEFNVDLVKKMGAKKMEVIVEGKPRSQIVLPSGNILTETAYTFIATEFGPMVIGAASTALGAMRDWMSYRNSLKVGGKQLPSFAKMYRLQTVLQQKDNNEWYNWKFSDIGYVTDQDLYMSSREFAMRVQKGEVQIGRPDYFDEGGDDAIPV